MSSDAAPALTVEDAGRKLTAIRDTMSKAILGQDDIIEHVLAAFVAMQILIPQLLSLVMTVPEPDMSRYATVTGNLGAAISLALILPLTASIPEEIIYRGFLMGRLSTLFGTDARGNLLTVAVQAVIFSSIHFTWGIGGIMMTFIMGIVWGTAYLLCGRNLWVVILAHSAGHLLFVTQLYLGAGFTG